MPPELQDGVAGAGSRSRWNHAAIRRRVVLLLVGSGCCALIYEIAWLRLLRLVFGASTAASAAVLAVFMGGLGFGGLLFGGRADRVREPLRLYAVLELGVALTAAATPWLIAAVHAAYIGLGGSAALGAFGSAGVRLALSAMVLGVPALLMGGTLPVAVRTVESAEDISRGRTGLLYGANTLGAVLGAMGANFVVLEAFGTRATIWTAAVVNLTIAWYAFVLVRRDDRSPTGETGISVGPVGDAARAALNELGVSGNLPTKSFPDPLLPSGLKREPARFRRAPESEERPCDASAPMGFVLATAAIVGFVFLLMELVWYRMLGPILGGSTYTFGLILTVALLGIGLGGLAYAARSPRQRATLQGLALSCAFEACCLVLPYALGDRVALLGLFLRPDGSADFVRFLGPWFLVTMIVVFPVAAVAGYQLPLLVGLAGRGDRRVGRDVGRVYAANTLGSIAGSLAGGFGLLPVLSAPGAWRLAVYVLAGLSAGTVVFAWRRGASRWPALVPLSLVLGSAVACGAQGPTAFWRQTGIGAGRSVPPPEGANAIRTLLHNRRLVTEWEADGVESSVGLIRDDAYSFMVNGKSDGNAIGDAPTQVMLGLIGAVFHPNPRRILVIGLGTGETAGWLAQVPSVERIDVFELEPQILRVAAACAAANYDVLANPKVHIVIGDARELLQTSTTRYDVVASEPSNPYRAGVASLFTREFYDAVAAHLAPDGVLTQWVQAYELPIEALRTIYRTVGTVFPSVETWELVTGQDLALVGRLAPAVHDVGLLETRVDTEPYRSALNLVSSVRGVEGLYTGFVADDAFTRDLQRNDAVPVNSDDRTVLEFACARSVGREWSRNLVDELRANAVARGHRQPRLTGGTIDWEAVATARAVRAIAQGSVPATLDGADPASRAWTAARQAYTAGNFGAAAQAWLSQAGEPQQPGDVRMVAEALSATADSRAPQYIDALRASQPAEAEALRALWLYKTGEPASAAAHAGAAFRTYRVQPWSNRRLMAGALDFAAGLASEHPEFAVELFEALSEPFAVRVLDAERLMTRASIGLRPGQEALCVAAVAPLEPNVPWERAFLEDRYNCYQRVGDPRATSARVDLDAFLANAGTER